MDLNWRQKAVLAGVLRDEQAIAAQDYHGGDNLPYMQRGNYRLRIRRAQEGYVPVNLQGWLAMPPSNSETVMFHREYLRLEKMGLLERHNLSGGTRTTHLRLTEAGRKMAEGTLGAEVPIDTNEPLNIADLDMSSLLPPEEVLTETDAPAAP